MADESQEAAGSAFELEYVTSTVGVGTGEAIGVQVVNDSGATETVRMVIYKNTGAGAVVMVDTGRVSVAAAWAWSSGFTVMDPADYWLRIQVTSESLIPNATFKRDEGTSWRTFESYRPGDFAVFSLTRKRLW